MRRLDFLPPSLNLEKSTGGLPPRRDPTRWRWMLGGLLLLGGVALAQLAPVVLDVGTQRTRPAQLQVVPDRFLQSWDPVTLFFPRVVGPAGGGPADDPTALVQLDPPQPGEWRWLDGSTLQFRPAEPWIPLQQVKLKVEGKTFEYLTRLQPPIQEEPAPNAEGLSAVKTLTLVFSEPTDPALLAPQLELRYRPLPGLDETQEQRLPPSAYRLKALERGNAGEPSRVRIELLEPVPPATRVLLSLQLAPGDKSLSARYETSFSTAAPFAIRQVACGGQSLPLSVEGTRYRADQALACAPAPRAIRLELTAVPESLTPALARHLVRLEPPVENLSFKNEDRSIEITGDFASGVLYTVRLLPTSLRDQSGRPLQLLAPVEVPLHFAPQPRYLQVEQGELLLERRGPQRLPLEARGETEVEVRIHTVDPLERSLWPFPEQPVEVNERERPPGPGELPAAFTDPLGRPDAERLALYLRSLSLPRLSERVSLPLKRQEDAARFGLDLKPLLEKVAGPDKSGTYLVGVKRLNGHPTRSWSRVQVTDLSLLTVEEPRGVVFQVSALSTGLPVSGASVKLEAGQVVANRAPTWLTVFQGTTNNEGKVMWNPPPLGSSHTLQRLVVSTADDTLVLDPQRSRQLFQDGYWRTDYGTWLDGTQAQEKDRLPPATLLAHLFSERPIYRPEEEVHLQAWVRERASGQLRLPSQSLTLVVVGPDDFTQRIPVKLSSLGTFYHRLKDENPMPVGTYTVQLEDAQANPLAYMSFQVEAYRIPRFEVRLQSPDMVPNDRPFDVSLTASFFAGGRLNAAPVRWRVTHLPELWAPRSVPGYYFSTDARFGGGVRNEAQGELERSDVSGEDGAARLTLDPGLEASSAPRRYVVEATVTGDDGQTVTQRRSVLSVPAFALGVKVPRFVEKPGPVLASLLVVDPKGQPLPDQKVNARLTLREWHSVLQEGDFSSEAPRYLTDVVETPISTLSVVSGKAAIDLPLTLPRAGVYVLEVEAQDRLGRSQRVNLDFFAAGDTPVAWQPPEGGVFSLTPDKSSYNPGELARVVVQSPYQDAQALAIVEGPDRTDYINMVISKGQGVLTLPLRKELIPSFPITVVLQRGRVAASSRAGAEQSDLSRPITLASTVWLTLTPQAHQVNMTLKHPEKALPGSSIPMEITLKDPAGKPLSGEVALWLVDQAVLSLAREARLDPVPSFLEDPVSRVKVVDARNLVQGALPFYRLPGGDGGPEEELDFLDKVTVRKDFRTVPFYAPAIQIGSSGKTTLMVKLPDNLTVFKVRAKVVSGLERFGYATGKVAVRLPVQVQPALPRFVRPGDQFLATALTRVVDGVGGEANAQARVEGLNLLEGASRKVALDPKQSVRVEFPVFVPTPVTPSSGQARQEVKLTIGVERQREPGNDAFEISLPIKPDRPLEIVRQQRLLEPGKSLSLDALPPSRVGSLRRQVWVSTQPALLQLVAGLEALRQYPFGCAEQRISRVRAELALSRLQNLLQLDPSTLPLDTLLSQTGEYLRSTQDAGGRVAFWPGSPGTVTLTAWSLELLVEAKAAGLSVDTALRDKLISTLKQSLRSDAGAFVEGQAWLERAWALSALARAGQFEQGYAAELLRQAEMLDEEGMARILLAFAAQGQEQTPAVQGLAKNLQAQLLFQLSQGREVFVGLKGRWPRSALLLGSETRAVAQVARALFQVEPSAPRLGLVLDNLISRGGPAGWGNPNADAEALLSLAARIEGANPTGPSATVALRLGADPESKVLTGKTPVQRWVSGQSLAGVLELTGGAPVLVREESRFIPVEPGAEMEARTQGFVLTRTVSKVDAQGGLTRLPLEKPGTFLRWQVGEVQEEQLQLVNPQERYHVALILPLAAGIEPLNPALATSPPEAIPRGRSTITPTYTALLDDQVAYFFNRLPAGTFELYVRTRASVPGKFIQPGATAALMYDEAVRAQSPGAWVEIRR